MYHARLIRTHASRRRQDTDRRTFLLNPSQSLICAVSTVLPVLSLLAVPPALGQNLCLESPVAVQILGSGGPFANDARASSSYVVWVAGQARVLVDAGGGAFVRFGESGARLEDLDLIAISHLHPDHVADLPALLWASNNFRSAPLLVSGPSGDDLYPEFGIFITKLFGSPDGVFPALSWTLGDGDNGYPLAVTSIDVARAKPSTVVELDELSVTALGVPHSAPALAYRVQVGNASIVFSSDQNGTNAEFTRFAQNADVLLMHFAISEQATGPVAASHASPAVVGRLAQQASVGTLVLSHFMGVDKDHPRYGTFSLDAFEDSIAAVSERYSGELITATDLQCIPVRHKMMRN